MFKPLNTLVYKVDSSTLCDICILCDQPVDNCQFCDAIIDTCNYHTDL